MKGKIIKSTGKWYIVELENSQLCTCSIRGKLRMDGLRTTNPLAVGDLVQVSEQTDDEGKRQILGFEKRRNYIVRKSTNLSKQMQIIAANIDCAYLVITIKNPQTQLAFIDRFLVSAESFRIPTKILINKIDLLNEEEMEYAQALSWMYTEIGYPTYLIQAEEPKSVEFLVKEINEKQVVISGHSGVGKSTLVNSLDSSLSLRTGEISKAHLQGQHTTTFAEMHKLSSGGYIIDTPGIRAFGIVDMEKEEIGHYFPEIRQHMSSCKFHNCKHLNEPKCAVKEAVQSGAIHESRYATYVQLMEEDPNEVYRKNTFS